MTFLLYGATGYTGQLIAEAAAARGMKPTLAGRSEAPLRALAQRLGLPHRAVSLDDANALDAALLENAVVLHCAGPFSRTSRPMVEACLRTRRHYLDITGEIGVFEAVAKRDAEAKAAGVMLLPGVGFDVVPSDCQAAHVKRLLPDATELHLCVAPLGTASHGTLVTTVEGIHKRGALRRGGRIVPSRYGAVTRAFDVAGKRRVGVSVPWGDVSTAWHSTGIDDITVYFTWPPRMTRLLKLYPLARPILSLGIVRRLMEGLIGPGGPDAAQRARGRSLVVAEAVNKAGQHAFSTLTGPEGYDLTVAASLLCVSRVLGGDAPAGFHTPSRAYGPDLVLSIPGVVRH